jgi:DNA repair exonuclease SbcCD nuclease subunit
MRHFVLDNNREIKKGVDFTQFTYIKRVFSGHIHKRQELVNSRYIYTGSPYHTKRSDIGNVKGVYCLNTETDEIQFTENNISPIFQRIKLEDILELTLSDSEEIFCNNYTDIIVPDKYIHLFNLTKFIDILKDCQYKKIETISESKSSMMSFGDISEDSKIKDILSLLETSIEELGHNPEIIEKLKKLNKDYYDKANKEDII